MVTDDFLLQGAVYALEQSGILLRDAVRLYNAGSYATAVVLAAFGWEELGREKILLSLRARVLQGETVTIDLIKAECVEHADKQRAGMLSIQIITHDDKSGLAKLLRKRAAAAANPQSQGWKEAEAELAKLDQRLQRRTPADRHNQRAAALYVDPRSEHQWNRPAEIAQLVAHQFIQAATNDYVGERDRRINIRGGDAPNAEIFDAIAKWSDRPDLPVPEVPSSPWP